MQSAMDDFLLGTMDSKVQDVLSEFRRPLHRVYQHYVGLGHGKEMDYNSFLALLKDTHQMDNVMTQQTALQLFMQVQQDLHATLNYGEFTDCLVAVSCFKNPAPWYELSFRLVSFLLTQFFPLLRGKVQIQVPQARIASVQRVPGAQQRQRGAQPRPKIQGGQGGSSNLPSKPVQSRKKHSEQALGATVETNSTLGATVCEDSQEDAGLSSRGHHGQHHGQGSDHDAEEKSSPSVQPSTLAAPPSPRLVNGRSCDHCLSPLISGCSFCHMCGGCARLHSTDSPRSGHTSVPPCPSCSWLLPGGTKFCGNCGFNCASPQKIPTAAAGHSHTIPSQLIAPDEPPKDKNFHNMSVQTLDKPVQQPLGDAPLSCPPPQPVSKVTDGFTGPTAGPSDGNPDTDTPTPAPPNRLYAMADPVGKQRADQSIQTSSSSKSCSSGGDSNSLAATRALVLAVPSAVCKEIAGASDPRHVERVLLAALRSAFDANVEEVPDVAPTTAPPPPVQQSMAQTCIWLGRCPNLVLVLGFWKV